jgi:hypothetical protein
LSVVVTAADGKLCTGKTLKPFWLRYVLILMLRPDHGVLRSGQTGPERASIRQIGQGRDTSTAKLAKLQETRIEAHSGPERNVADQKYHDFVIIINIT